MPKSVPPPTDSSQQARRVRVLVTGSRDWDDRAAVRLALQGIVNRVGSITVVHGDCPKGADRFAKEWATDRCVPQEPHPADWRQYGKRAGFIRNSEMAKLGADLCLAFIRNDSNGATHCALAAENNDIPTVVFRQSYPDLSQVADALALSEVSG